jgi:hypothetical protein
MNLTTFICLLIIGSLFNTINTQNADTDWNALDLSSLDMDFALNDTY